MLAINAYAELKDGLNPITEFKCCAKTIPSKTFLGKILAQVGQDLDMQDGQDLTSRLSYHG